ncbi:hypothetical protein RYA05_04715 [Pseudomonas syringae pv. actinidiae]|nr:hypothetical protein [Pseudomonas syringae pv. actinidiae]
MTQQANTTAFNVTLKLRDEPRMPWAERVFEHIKASDYLGAMNEAIKMARASGKIVGKCVSVTH